MNKLKVLTLCAITFLIGVCTQAQLPVEQPQIVLRFLHEEGGKSVVEVQARTVLKLTPLNDEHPAPLGKSDILLCHPYTQEGHLRLRCGMDHYGVVAVSFQEK